MSSARSPLEGVLAVRQLAFARPPSAQGPGFRLEVERLDVLEGEVLALCGPSGSGKSTLLAIMAGLLEPEAGTVTLATEAGSVDLFSGSRRNWRSLRRHIGFVHQDPRESLNDRRVVSEIVADPLDVHRLPGLSPTRRGRRERALEILQHVGISATQAKRTPTALSGGQRQRVAIARALVARPRLVFLDEPTSALDVSVQASIVELLQTLRAERPETSYVLVTHDLPLARQLADRVAILDQGRVVEMGAVDDVFRNPRAAATRELLGIARSELEAFGPGHARINAP